MDDGLAIFLFGHWLAPSNPLSFFNKGSM